MIKMARPKQNSTKQLPSIQSTPPKRIISFYNSINDIINKFENSQKALDHIHNSANGMLKTQASFRILPSKKRNHNNDLSNYSVNICSAAHVNETIKLKNRTWRSKTVKMVDSISDDISDSDSVQLDDGHTENHIQHNDPIATSETYDSIENIDDPNIYEYAPFEETEVYARPTRFMRLRNMNIVQCQFNMFQRFIGILLSFPFFSSVNGAGLSTLTCAFFLPRFLCENLLYPVFRLVLGTLYPAYASYKAVRNKDVKDYVSTFNVQFAIIY